MQSLSSHPGLLFPAFMLLSAFAPAAPAEQVIVPVRVVASSSMTSAERPRDWSADNLRLGALHFNPETGDNTPHGLRGYEWVDGAMRPVHEGYRTEPSHHPKAEGMWMSAAHDIRDAWLEFELPGDMELDEIWIWNWNDAPEVGRRVRHATLQTSTLTQRAGAIGEVDYDVIHTTFEFPDIGHRARRTPDVVYQFPAGTTSRYVRLSGMDNFGDDRTVGLAEVLVTGAGEPAEAAAHENKERTMEPYWYLFLDDHVIERSTGFQRVVRHPRPRGIVLEPDRLWERIGLTPLYVGRRKDGRLECYYRAHGPQGPNDAYAISTDGLHWEKPNLGLVEFRGSKENNLIPVAQPRDLFMHGNVSDPARRYTLHTPGNPASVFFSRETPDFLNDPDWRDNLVDAGGFQPSDYNTLEFWDDLHGEWVAMRQAPNHPPTRCGGRYASPDLKNWTLAHFLYPDAHDSTDPRYFHEVYGILSVHVEGMVLGYAYWFTGDRTHPNPDMYRGAGGRVTTDKDLVGKSVAKGTMEVRLVTSRDGGKTWDRTVSREAWIPHGKEQDSYDRYVRLDAPPFRNGDEDWFYCSGYDGDHSGFNYYHSRRNMKVRGLLYTQKHNRYVSLTAGNDPRVLITRPLEVTGETLQLNVDGSRGEVRVGIGIDKIIPHPSGQWKFKAVLPHWMVEDRWQETHLEEGFHINDCEPLQANSIQHNVNWENADLASLQGKIVRLYIMVQDADLYGFRFR